ncbi:hypothetical protein ACEQPO_06145 [Bacillus sp. SL00103]
MSQFDIQQKYIPMLQEDPIGEWVIDQENDGTAEHPIQMPFVNYSETVRHLIADIYTFAEQHEEMAPPLKS